MTPPKFKTFGEWLHYHRADQRYSMRAIGRAAGVSGTYISTLETNRDLPQEMSPRPSMSVVKRLASAFKTDVAEPMALAGWTMHEGEGSNESELESGEYSWRDILHEMETKLADLPPARVEKMVALWHDQFIPHYELYRQFQEEEQELEEIKKRRGERKKERELEKAA